MFRPVSLMVFAVHFNKRVLISYRIGYLRSWTFEFGLNKEQSHIQIQEMVGINIFWSFVISLIQGILIIELLVKIFLIIFHSSWNFHWYLSSYVQCVEIPNEVKRYILFIACFFILSLACFFICTVCIKNEGRWDI